MSLSLYGLLCVGLLSLAESVTTPEGALTTRGDSLIHVFGSFLGLAHSAVSLTYAGGSDGLAPREYRVLGPDGCVILVSGTNIACRSVAGVGANFTFWVTVHGGKSAGSIDTYVALVFVRRYQCLLPVRCRQSSGGGAASLLQVSRHRVPICAVGPALDASDA
jgi:hypothetical protein